MRPPHPLGLVCLFSFAVGLGVPLLPVPTQAQPLPPGRWTGEIINADGRVLPVSYDVTHDDSLAIRVHIENIGTFPLDTIVLEDGVLTFGWEPGARLECTLLHQQDGRYEGECEDFQGGSGVISMRPPPPPEEQG